MRERPCFLASGGRWFCWPVLAPDAQSPGGGSATAAANRRISNDESRMSKERGRPRRRTSDFYGSTFNILRFLFTQVTARTEPNPRQKERSLTVG